MFQREICVSLAVRFLTILSRRATNCCVCCLWCQAGEDGVSEFSLQTSAVLRLKQHQSSHVGCHWQNRFRVAWSFSNAFIFFWLHADRYFPLIFIPSVWLVTLGTNWKLTTTICMARVQHLTLKLEPLSLSFCLPGQQQISHSHNDAATILGPDPSFTFESIFNFSLFHSRTANAETLSPAKISFWQTMQWIKGHTWPPLLFSGWPNTLPGPGTLDRPF